MPDMAEKLGVGTEVRELKIGQSFLNQRKGNTYHSKSGSSRSGHSNSSRNGDHKGTEDSYHTIRYDFKPASSNTSSTGFLDVDDNNRVSVKIPHEGGGQTNFSGHQKEANLKDCLLIIDHVTGEITLEKLSSQIMVKKTRSEKPDLKNASQDSSINITPSNSRPHTPVNSAKQEPAKSGTNKKSVAGNKLAGRGNQNYSSGSTKNAPNHNEILTSNTKRKGTDNLSSGSSTDSSIDSDSDSDASSKVVKGSMPMSSGGVRYRPGPAVGSSASIENSSLKHSNQSSPSNSRVASPKRKDGGVEAKQFKPIQSTSKNSSQGAAKLSDLNDEFDDSDDSENDESNSGEEQGQDFSLGRFAPNSSSQIARSAPNMPQYKSKPNNRAHQGHGPKMNLQSKHSSNSPKADTSVVQSMPQFLNDDLELSESDSDS